MVLRINSIFPVTGRFNEATNITIIGEDFSSGLSVTIGEQSVANLLVVNATRLTCTIPNDLEEGVYDLSIMSVAEQTELENAFIVAPSFPSYPFNSESFPVIQTRILNRLPNNYEKFEGSTIYDFIAPLSLEFQELYFSLATILDLGSVFRSTGSYLVFKGIETGVVKRGSTKAIGEVTFTGTQAVTIPSTENNRFEVSNTPTDADITPIRFTVNESLTLVLQGASYVGTVGITAIEDGKAGNLDSGAINNIISPIPGLTTVTNANATGSGSDEESELEHRSRILAQALSPARAGNVENYKQWARESSIYVGKIGVDPLRRDENNGTVQPGTVGVYFLNVDGTTPDAALISTVSNYIGPDNEGKGRAPIGADVHVAAPSFVDIHVRVDITASAGFVESSVITVVEEAITNYLYDLNIGDNVLYHTLGSIIISTNGVDSITDYYVSSVNTTPINTDVSDIEINNTQKAQAGTITVS